jgi:hypothetical protein
MAGGLYKENIMPFISVFEQREIDAEKRGLLKGIRAMLTVQLPQQAQSLLARVEHVDDVAMLDRILQAAT